MTTFPSLRVYVDWDNLASSTHDFTGDARADMTGKVSEPFKITRGRSLDFSGDAKGQLTFVIPVGKVNGSFARQVLATPGLVGYWPLGEASGTVAADSAGVDVGVYVATPTLAAAGPLVGDTSTAVTLNGSTQYVTVPDSTSLDLADGPLTIAAWVKRSTTGTEDAIVGKGTGGYYLYIGSDDKVYLAKQGTGNVAGTTVTIVDTSWHLVVATYSGTTTGKVYIDAVDRTTSTATQTLADTAVALGFGSQSGASAAAPFAGSLAHVALWDVALTQAQVTAIYAAATTQPVFPAYDRIGRGDVMLGRRVLVLADYLTDTNKPLFSGRIVRLTQAPETLDIAVTCQDDLENLQRSIPVWQVADATYRELRMEAIRKVQQFQATYDGYNFAGHNPNGGASRAYWTSVPSNRIANPGFETSTTGWSITGDAGWIANASVSITRTAGGKHGSWRAAVVPHASGYSGTWYGLSSTFTAGRTYRYSVWVRTSNANTTIAAALYSNGTPADISETSWSTLGSAGIWHNITGNWVPTADRTDVHFGVRIAGTGYALDVDSAAIWVVDSVEGAYYDLNYADPLCLSSTARESVVSRVVGTGPYGLGTYIRGTAASGAAVAMPFQGSGAWGILPGEGGVPPVLDVFYNMISYTATAWLKGTGTGRIRFGRQSTGGASSTTVTLSSSWQKVSVTWAPVSGVNVYDAWLVAESTGATIEVGGVTVVEGSTAWDWCPTVGMDGLDTAEDAFRVCAIEPSGTPLDVLKALNACSFARHWIEPLAVYPWWRYRTRVLSSLAGKSVAETYDDDIAIYTGDEQSYDSLINDVTWTTGSNYYDGSGVLQTPGTTTTGEQTDDASVATWGFATVAIGGTYLEPNSTAPATIAAYILDAYSEQRRRFSFTVENRWPSQLLRDLDELVVLNLPRLGIIGGHFIVVGIAHDIGATGRRWRTTYQVEAAPPP